ncbi:MAG: carbohydrate ABC transporter permease, partial [Spirochaetales bacterium]|nr:carbohydrate ABC transporter permease [Spirochaetales bacterium]
MAINNKDQMAMKGLSYALVAVASFFAFIPFLVLVISSFTAEQDIILNGFRIFPEKMSTDAYALIFKNPTKIANAYSVTLQVTIIGTLVSLFFSSMTAFVLFRKEVKYRSALAFFLYFTELFNGGLAAFYIVVGSMLGLRNSMAVLMLVPMFHVFHILILRNFMNSVPYSLIESANIDGANDLQIFLKVILPLSKPA